MDLIITTNDLDAACRRLSRHPYVTVDTEFLRETTYYSKLCLIQMAGPDEAVLVDPLAEAIDLEPFFALMGDERVEKVFHSARQDVEIMWQMGNTIPKPLFDTQVAAMVCGYGDSVSYEQLVGDFADARIDKSSRFTDWSRRPLSDQQLAYAVSDVTHLRVVYAALRTELAKTGRESWLAEEMAVLTAPATYEMKPEDAWQRLKGRVRKPKEAAILMEVAAWREREARARNVPRARILKDDAVIDVVTHAPRTTEALSHLRSIPNGFERSRASADILAAVARGLTRDLESVPILARGRTRQSNGATIDLLKVLLKAVAEAERVAPKIIATVDDLEAIALDDDAEVAAMHGWRRKIFGEKALDLKRGKLALAVDGGRVRMVER